MICSLVNRFFISPSYHGRTLQESGGVLGAQVAYHPHFQVLRKTVGSEGLLDRIKGNDYYLRSANVNLMGGLLGLTHGSATQHPIRENWLTANNARSYRGVDCEGVNG